MDKHVLSTALPAFQNSGSDDEDQKDAAVEAQRLKALGIAFAEQGNWESALGSWNRAVQLAPIDGHLHELCAQALNETGKAWAAVQAATRACGLLPQSCDALMTLARAQLNLGEPKLAVASMERVLKIQSEHPEALSEIEEVRALACRQDQLGAGIRAFVSGPPSRG
ncbi:hypothetical protein CEUSTIGMA_g1479.t1 [Chlamydomonas eustigma]|uniref:Uncharacterized protein n=1 Tax=Chlamydomonas eustigma TaxID=1157962 RepID=A0A250WTG0_9CHLO|nr:hypothetical protein CEUSTIGMA_g1479.t1 [Chlamydomonas eustigma]|eukprot:GAX74029.1 hypothetical protein CEUSTIGMA_g1479.t1 [Chlamydomonas eustigma]